MSTRTLAMTIEDFRTVDSGSRIRDYHMCSTLAEYGAVDVLAFAPQPPAVGRPLPFAGRVFVDTRQSALKGAFGSVFQRRQLHAVQFDPAAHRDFARLRLESYDLIYCSMPYSAPVAARLSREGPSAGAPVIWDTHNYDPDVFRALADSATGVRKIAISSQIRLAERATRAAADTANVVIACTRDDAALFGALHDNVRLVPNAADVDTLWQAGVARQPAPHSVVVFGSLFRDSTDRGAQWMISDVWPIVRAAVPDSLLIITGRAPTQQLLTLAAAADGVRLAPDPNDIQTVVVDAQVVAIPETWGTGSKLKMAEALATTLTGRRNLRRHDGSRRRLDAVHPACRHRGSLRPGHHCLLRCEREGTR